MCGRYTLSAGHEALAREFLAEFAEEMRMSWNPRYNITPGTGIVGIHEDRDKGGRKAEVFHWGLVPSWAKDPDIGYKLINARAETIAEKPSFRDAFRYRRCLVPANGFYEWDRTKSPRQPYYFHPGSQDFMALAGIWEHWLHPSGSEILSVSLITTEANSLMQSIHHRMPLILPKTAWASWLSTESVRPSISPFLDAAEPEEFLICHPVSTRVNKATEEGADLIQIQEVPGDSGGQLDLF